MKRLIITCLIFCACVSLLVLAAVGCDAPRNDATTQEDAETVVTPAEAQPSTTEETLADHNYTDTQAYVATGYADPLGFGRTFMDNFVFVRLTHAASVACREVAVEDMDWGDLEYLDVLESYGRNPIEKEDKDRYLQPTWYRAFLIMFSTHDYAKITEAIDLLQTREDVYRAEYVFGNCQGCYLGSYEKLQRIIDIDYSDPAVREFDDNARDYYDTQALRANNYIEDHSWVFDNRLRVYLTNAGTVASLNCETPYEYDWGDLDFLTIEDADDYLAYEGTVERRATMIATWRRSFIITLPTNDIENLIAIIDRLQQRDDVYRAEVIKNNIIYGCWTPPTDYSTNQ